VVVNRKELENKEIEKSGSLFLIFGQIGKNFEKFIRKA